MVANRCTDATVELARAAGAIVVEDESRNISAVRNAGAAVATGAVIIDDRRRLRDVARNVPRDRATPRHRPLRGRRDEGGARATIGRHPRDVRGDGGRRDAHPARRRALLVSPVRLRGSRRVRRVAAAGRGPRLRPAAPRARQADRSPLHDHAGRADRRVVPEVRPVRRLAHVRAWRCRPARSAP